jgi:hypothetical protein
VNCIGKNTWTNVDIKAKYAVSLVGNGCNDFVGGSIVGEETGVTVSPLIDEQTGRVIGVPAPVTQQPLPASKAPQ